MIAIVTEDLRRPVTNPDRLPVGSVLLQPGKAPGDLTACRLIRIETTHPGEWPWRRLTGVPAAAPPRHTDLSEWQQQPVGDLGVLFEHATILTGHEVGR